MLDKIQYQFIRLLNHVQGDRDRQIILVEF